MSLLECEEETGGQSGGEPLAAVETQMKMAESWKCKEDSRNSCRSLGFPRSLSDADAAGTIAA